MIMKRYFITPVIIFFAIFSIIGQTCSRLHTFTWQGASSGNQAVWNTDDTLNVYKNIFGIDVEVKIIDPFKQNTTTQNPSVFNDYTKTNTFFGRGALAFQITAEKPRQDVCLEISFSKPITLHNFNIWDIDFIADLRHPSGNYQDYITLASSLEDVNVPLQIFTKSNNPNFIIENQTIVSHYVPGTRNELRHTDPDGAITISSTNYIDKIIICYSNGPADNGPSNGQAMKITEFSFCQKLGNVMGFTLEEDTNKPVANVQLCLENIDGTPFLNFDGQPFTSQSDANGYYFIDNIPLGIYRIVQKAPEGFKYMHNMDNEPDSYNTSNITYTLPTLQNLNFYYEPISPLSVNFISWDVKNLGQKADIRWATATENQSDYFSIATSSDGTNYTNAAKIKAMGLSNNLTKYQYQIVHPFTESYYIQLVQHDFNGTKYILGTQKVIQKNETEWSVFPNPTHGILNMKTLNDNTIHYRVIVSDALGKVLISSVITQNEHSLDLNILPQGVYSLLISDGIKNETFQVVKQ